MNETKPNALATLAADLLVWLDSHCVPCGDGLALLPGQSVAWRERANALHYAATGGPVLTSDQRDGLAAFYGATGIEPSPTLEREVAEQGATSKVLYPVRDMQPQTVAEVRAALLLLAGGEAKPVAAESEADWILASQALPRLGWTYKQLREYAAENPDKLRTRKHPEHGRRQQVNAADVLKLEMAKDKRNFAALDAPEANALPSISDSGMEKLAKRVAATRANKGQK